MSLPSLSNHPTIHLSSGRGRALWISSPSKTGCWQNQSYVGNHSCWEVNCPEEMIPHSIFQLSVPCSPMSSKPWGNTFMTEHSSHLPSAFWPVRNICSNHCAPFFSCKTKPLGLERWPKQVEYLLLFLRTHVLSVAPVLQFQETQCPLLLSSGNCIWHMCTQK